VKVKSEGKGGEADSYELFAWICRLSVKHASRTRVVFVVMLPGILGGKKGGILYDGT